MPVILDAGYETAVRSKLGARESELPDTEINQPLVVDLSENVIIERVPEFASITDPKDKLFLENAVVNYICYLLAPSMTRRVNLEVATIDTKWKKDKIDWVARAQEYLMEVETSLKMIGTVEIVGYDSKLFGIASVDGANNR